MALIPWQEEFSVGVPGVDLEHRELIGLINELHGRLGESPDTEEVLDFLGEIYAKISAHFALEERAMREHDYDEYEDHKSDHERLLDEIRDLMDDYEDGFVYSDHDMSRRLSEWFAVHFRTRDARLHQQLG